MAKDTAAKTLQKCTLGSCSKNFCAEESKYLYYFNVWMLSDDLASFSNGMVSFSLNQNHLKSHNEAFELK